MPHPLDLTPRQIDLLLEAIALRQEWEEQYHGRPSNLRPAVRHDLQRLKEAVAGAESIIIRPR